MREEPSSRPATAKKTPTKGSLFDDSSDSDGASAPTPKQPSAEKAPAPILEVAAEREQSLEIETKGGEKQISGAEEEEEDEMSKPVLKSFEAGFSDRLAAAIKQGPVMRGVC